jgi:biotin-(acetyl-CoA carboxylase) ligase
MTLLTTELSLPPPFSLVTLREVGDAFAHAKEIAGEQGAGTLVYVGRFDLAEFAVVLEPEEPLRSARRAFYAGMVALSDALTAFAPPETPMDIVWPDALRVNLGLVGGARVGWPKNADENKAPSWLVFAAMVRMVSFGEEPGVTPLSTALEEEGFADVNSGRLMESFARNFMTITDLWQERGFDAVAKEYLQRLPAERGVRRNIDGNGDLLINRMGNPDVERKALLPALARPSWLDPKTRGPKR